MNFKFFKGDEVPSLVFAPHIFNPQNVEFCFQFDDEEPRVFAVGPNECNISISPSPNGSIIFDNNGRIFKLFAREINNV